jgi:hypothetical protein
MLRNQGKPIELTFRCCCCCCLLLLLQVANTLAKEVLTSPGQEVEVISTNEVEGGGRLGTQGAWKFKHQGFRRAQGRSIETEEQTCGGRWQL